MVRKSIPLLLSVVLLSGITACNKAEQEASQPSPAPAANSNNAASNSSAPSGSNSTKPTQAATVPTGTTFDTTLQQDLSTGKNRNQDRFTLRVKTGLFGGNATLKNAEIRGHLENIVKAARGRKATLHLVFDDITLSNKNVYPIDVTLVNTKVESKTQGTFLKNVGIILGGATAGHFVGNKANFKHGGLAGGAAAAAYVLSSPGGEVVLKKGTELKLKLKSALNAAP